MIVNNETLQRLGYKPCPEFKTICDKFKNVDASETEVIIFSDSLIKKSEFDILQSPLPYNIFTDSEDGSWKKDMDFVMSNSYVVSGVIMPDVSKVQEKHIPVGGVVVCDNVIVPDMHSADVCCSVFISNVGKVDPKIIFEIAKDTTHFGNGINEKVDNNIPDWLEKEISSNYITSKFINNAKIGLGTQGDGNHFLFVGVSKLSGDTCIVTHHGSRSFGAKVYKEGLKNAIKENGCTPYIKYDSVFGGQYWEAIQITRKWTKYNHELIHDTIIAKSDSTLKDRFWNEHNFVFKKDNLFYHAKGSTPLLDEFVPDNKHGLRLIPLNMGQPILIVSNKTVNPDSLGFAPHGAGRVKSRSEFEKNIDNSEEFIKMDTEGIEAHFFNGVADLSELPSAYRSPQEIIDSIDRYGLGVLHDEILPFGSIMCGKKTYIKRKKVN